MAGFRFSLQQVLEYREQLKDQAQIEYARAHAELLREQRQAELLQAQLAEQQKTLAATPPEQRDDRWLLDNYIKGLREDLSETLMRVRNLTAITEEARQQLAIRAKDHKILEKLKAKQAERHAREALFQEQRTYDETAAIRFKAPTL